MNTPIQDFLDYLLKLSFKGDNLSIELAKGTFEEMAPLSEEEIHRYRNRSLLELEELTINSFSLGYKNDAIALVPFDDINIQKDNFFVFHLYSEALKAVDRELGDLVRYKDKKAYLKNLQKEVCAYRSRFYTNHYNNIKLFNFQDSNSTSLSKQLYPYNLWAITELLKRYFDTFENHINSLCELVHHSFDSLRRVRLTKSSKLIWVCGETGIEGVVFQLFFEALKRRKFIHCKTTLQNFKRVFSPTGFEFEKIIWVESDQQLHFLIKELIGRKALMPFGDRWEAITNSFKQDNGIDFNRGSVKSNSHASDEEKEVIIGLLDACGVNIGN